jgi:transposase
MYYIGSHKGKITDGYKGSGKYFKNAYKRNPENFKRRILEYTFVDQQDLFKHEQYWIDFIKDDELGEKYYNLKNIADGGPIMYGYAHPLYRHDINIDVLLRMNKIDSMNSVEIAKVFDCSYNTILNKFREYEEEFIHHINNRCGSRNSNFKYDITPEELIHMNHNLGMNYNDIAKYFGCKCGYTISEKFKYFNLEYIKPELKLKTGKDNPLSRLWKLYFEDKSIEPIFTYELQNWAKENCYSHGAIRNIFYGKNKSTGGKSGKFGKIIKVEQFPRNYINTTEPTTK